MGNPAAVPPDSKFVGLPVPEGDHRQLRKATKGKSIFPNDEALTKMLYLATMEVTRKWTMRVANWGQILGQLAIYLEERLAPHLTK